MVLVGHNYKTIPDCFKVAHNKNRSRCKQNDITYSQSRKVEVGDCLHTWKAQDAYQECHSGEDAIDEDHWNHAKNVEDIHIRVEPSFSKIFVADIVRVPPETLVFHDGKQNLESVLAEVLKA